MLTALIAHPSAGLYGSDRVMLESITALVERQWRVVVTLPELGPLVSEIEARGAEVRLCPAPVLRKSALKPAGLLRLGWEIARSIPAGIKLIRSVHADLMYISTITLPVWFGLARVMRVPVVGHVHEAEQTLPVLVRRVLATPLLIADRLIVNSHYCLEVLMESYSSLAKKSTVIYNGIQGPKQVLPARSELGDAIRLLYVGRLSARKGPDVAIALVHALQQKGIDVRLDLVGSVVPGQDAFAIGLLDQVASLELGRAVSFHGFQSDIFTWVRESDIVVIPSQSDESFGNSAVEAVLAARPVIASGARGLSEALDGYESAQTVAATDLDGWSAAVLRVRDRWSDFRNDAISDATRAQDIHAPARYRASIADELEVLAGGVRSLEV